MADQRRTANRLINETSPYLLQHAYNPVDWYPWGQEALEHARREDKPILLSIGYSACHWCHVMERESFEDEETARMMNEHFVNIKVDREERPDLDSLYMAAVQAMTGHGGWPMTVFLTPEGEPFFGGTYFPPEPRYGMPSFKQVLLAVVDAYKNRRNEVTKSANELTLHLQLLGEMPEKQAELKPLLVANAFEMLSRQFDENYGGFGRAPKFPQPMALEVVLRHYHRTGAERALAMLQRTLTEMAYGGIYDQLGGGFHRYSVDERWLVPHFEKMLYDNALLSRLYLETYLVTGEPLFRRIAEETIDYILRDMTAPEGGFYSTEDADSEGEEGRFYTWTLQELRQVLGEDATVAAAYWDVSEAGNFEGRNILHVQHDPLEFARQLAVSLEELQERVAGWRRKLLEARSQRVRPGRDEKMLTAWNGLMLRSLAEAGRALRRDDYIEAARRNADFLLNHLRRDGRLLRSYKDGQAKIKGFLDDYAFLIDGLLELYQATFELRWMREAKSLTETMLQLFWDEERQIFFDTSTEHEQLISRPRDPFDNATPSGTSVAVDVLLRLAALLGEPAYMRTALSVLRGLSAGMVQLPSGFGRLLAALDFYVSTPKEIAIIGEPDAPDTQRLIEVVFGRYLPNKVVAGAAPDNREAAELIPLLQDRPMLAGQATAYVCTNYTCKSPTADPDELARQLTETQGTTREAADWMA
ncbi:MAG: thioredoxin domain-containing protein [Herpetosiphonaceae bacterium]|nr:MAG: thioredoxin domain-containing protein [Herpetosiphonaceae bacterium]